MEDFRKNDTFSSHFKDVVEDIKESDELAQIEANINSDTYVDMSEEFKDNVLKVIKVIRTLDDTANKVDMHTVLGTMATSAITLAMTNAAIQAGRYNTAVGTGVLTLACVAVFVGTRIYEKKRAIQDINATKAASGLNDRTFKIILKQMAKEGNDAALSFVEDYYKENKGPSL